LILDKLIQKKVDAFTKPYRIQFEKISLCLLPKEAILLVQLYSTNSIDNLNPANSLIINGVTMPHETNFINNDTCLAWASKSFFNDKL
jgi:hypothetical protein